ncbi:Rrf2 family transcriptional regulator [Candidatus Synechococcus calcipolaris G9]|uniref:Rrf2 family transcriptional regulator n=1 Tax=Candidatus Synechococcus calcipolaris G9 TaxID=1497997 RepID=A0ABT6EYR5_9SYNE|nr:Rrf2 family transcriptional regulator [Candidatus Synechococcus calcipolaris]MDG2990456.1 Rrf2 family transcriptional regulator [Candidatus Synechococcus calcipolaris G9]
MELSSKSEYALLALLEMSEAYRKEEPMQIRQIAAMHNIPDRYLEQLLATLRRQGLIRSQRGARGGYLLAKAPWHVTLLDVLDCIEGVDTTPTHPATHSEDLERSVIRAAWQEACQAANTVLENYTLQDLCDRRRSKKQLDIMYYI